jgi:Holliday junction resolvase RusA-like endonuclease
MASRPTPELGAKRPVTGRLQFTVLGRPVPAGSKRAFVIKKGGVPTNRAAMVEDSKKRVRPWQELIKSAALDAMGATGPLDGPLILKVDFYLARPKAHYGSGRNADRLKPGAPLYPAVKPDATKLLRGLEDALTGLAWHDDAQVVDQAARKRYGLPERVEVLVDIAAPSLDEIDGWRLETRPPLDMASLFDEARP